MANESLSVSSVPDEFLDKALIGDCLEILAKLPQGCIKLFVTDPPYNQRRYYGDHPANFENVSYAKYLQRMDLLAKLAYHAASEDGYFCT